jgi:thioredoxin reductase
MAAGLQLARARRQVLVIDAGRRRNRFTRASHGFLGQDGKPPEVIANEARAQLLAYPTVSWIDATAERADGSIDAFSVTASGTAHQARRLILATGVVDELPEVAGLRERWGRSVFVCPYCDGYELNQGQIGVLAADARSFHHAMLLPDWGSVTLFTNGAYEPSADERAALARRGVVIEPTPVTAIEGEAATVVLSDGRSIALSGLFVLPRTHMASPLAAQLGCGFEDGIFGPIITTDPMKATSVAGVYACGDVARTMASVSLAVADGAMAGVAAHQSLVFSSTAH